MIGRPAFNLLFLPSNFSLFLHPVEGPLLHLAPNTQRWCPLPTSFCAIMRRDSRGVNLCLDILVRWSVDKMPPLKSWQTLVILWSNGALWMFPRWDTSSSSFAELATPNTDTQCESLGLKFPHLLQGTEISTSPFSRTSSSALHGKREPLDHGEGQRTRTPCLIHLWINENN